MSVFPRVPSCSWGAITEPSEGPGVWAGAFWEDILLSLPNSLILNLDGEDCRDLQITFK